MRVRRLSDGRLTELAPGTHFAEGGEAHLYNWPHDPSLVAKVYKQPDVTRADKLRVMLSAPPDGADAGSGRARLAWPVDLLALDRPAKPVIGFLMPRVVSARPLIDVYTPGTRRKLCPGFTYRYLVTSALNAATLIQTVHARGYVVADIRESNLLVSDDATVTLVDVDSFQVTDPAAGRVYRCPVGTPEYTPPELRGRDFEQVDRTEAHDRFGLAVLIWLLLMEGVHPFDGRHTGSGEAPPRDERIAAGHFPHGVRKCPIVPGPLALPFDLLPAEVGALTRRCFVDGHHLPGSRPAAEEWRAALRACEQSLKACSSNTNHVYPGHLRSCPWCERTTKLAGRDPFPAPADIRAGRHLAARTPAPTRPPTPAPPRPPAAPASPYVPAPVPVQASPRFPVARPNRFAPAACTAAALGVAACIPGAPAPAPYILALTAVALAVAAVVTAGHAARLSRAAMAAAALSALFVFGRPVWSAMTTQGDRPAGAQAQSSWLPAPGKKVGDTIRNPRDGATLVWVPAGAFTMGSDSGDSDAQPARKVTLSGYWIYKTEVTVAQYRKYCDATGADMPEAPEWGWKDDHPVVNITWDDATAYSAWAGVSLPTEAQWEKAARGTDGREYPWGNEWSVAKCVNSVGELATGTQPVGSKPAGASPYGCQDMAGNAWEWCADWYSDGYYASAPDRNPTGPAQGERGVLRGGSWIYDDADYFRAHPFAIGSTLTIGTTIKGFGVSRPRAPRSPLVSGPFALCRCRCRCRCRRRYAASVASGIGFLREEALCAPS